MDFYNIILIFGAVQGLLLSTVLAFKMAGARNRNYYFLLLITLISAALISKIGFEFYQDAFIPQFWYIADSIAYFIGPLWYLTLKSSIKSKEILSFRDKLLLFPFTYYLLFLIYIFSLSQEELTTFYGDIWSYISFQLFCTTVLLVNAYFLFRSYVLIKSVKTSRFPDFLIKGQYSLLSVLAIWLISYIIAMIFGKGLHVYIGNFYEYAFLGLSFLLISFAYLAMLKPASYYFLTQVFDPEEENILKEIASRVEKVIAEEHPFLKPDYSLNELSNEVGANSVMTSQAVNRILKKSFADLINGYRVRHFLKLVKQESNNNLTHWALARDSGFGNKMSFYSAFKKETGMTPKTYLSSMSA